MDKSLYLEKNISQQPAIDLLRSMGYTYISPEDCEALLREYPRVRSLMLGQGLLRNPALIRQARGGPPPTAEELRAFHDELYHSYLEAFRSARNTIFHMKELWSFLGALFAGSDRLLKQIRKAQDAVGYERAVDQIFRTLPVRWELPEA